MNIQFETRGTSAIFTRFSRLYTQSIFVMQSVTVENPVFFDQIFSDTLPAHKNTLVYVYASNDPSTGESWCSDTRKAVPFIKEVVSKGNGAFLDCPAGSREEYRHSAYKSHPVLKVTNVPTLYLFGRTSGSSDSSASNAPNALQKVQRMWVESECYAVGFVQQVLDLLNV